MDEVDGMSAGDRGGVADLIQVRVVGVGGVVCVSVFVWWGGGPWEGGDGPLLRGPARPRLLAHCIPPPPAAPPPFPNPACPPPPRAPPPQTIKNTRVPIICICNEKYSTKLRSLRNHTLELDFRK